MPTSPRQSQAIRWLRQSRAYRFGVRGVLPLARRSELLDDLAWRMVAPKHLAGQVDVPFRGGSHLRGDDVQTLPVVGLMTLGASREQLVEVLGQVAELQRRTRGFRPLLIVDVPVFAEAREHGYVVDLVTPRSGWTGDEGSWETYVAHRAAAAVDDYQLWSLLQIPPTGPSPLDVALLEQLAQRLSEDRDVHTTGRAT